MPPINRCGSARFYDADGELLIVPQLGSLLLVTELGRLSVEPLEIAVIPRGVRFRVELPDDRRTRLCLRKLRRAIATAGSGADRLQWPGLRARFPDARARLTRIVTSRAS